MNYEMGGTILSKTVKEKDLGVTMNANMKVSEQCYEIMGFTRRSGVSATFAKTTVHTSNIHFVCPPICTGTFPIFAQVKQNTAFLSFECSS